ncbi:MAG: hypothetical protein DWQ29_23295 [Planctomycetota bacterium]|nr:MAG: hypothetical protein DWQ29_23295 [Planctomycetota bacterium]
MAFTESLTVWILGDSSHLKSELESAASDIRNLQTSLNQAGQAGEQIGQGFARASSAMRPLQEISRMLSRLTTQAETLGRTPIRLNVQPALQALGTLSGAIQAIAGQLRALSAIPVGIGAGPIGGGGPIRRFAEGGLVTGPSGRDVVPALLSAGEFVMSRRATEALGSRLLEAVNSAPTARPARIGTAMSAPPARVTTNNFGGVTIQVADGSQVNGIVRDLRLQGVHLRNRRG